MECGGRRFRLLLPVRRGSGGSGRSHRRTAERSLLELGRLELSRRQGSPRRGRDRHHDGTGEQLQLQQDAVACLHYSRTCGRGHRGVGALGRTGKDRKSGGEGKRGSGRVENGGRRSMKKKKKEEEEEEKEKRK